MQILVLVYSFDVDIEVKLSTTTCMAANIGIFDIDNVLSRYVFAKCMYITFECTQTHGKCYQIVPYTLLKCL